MTALTKGQIALCLMAVSSQEVGGFTQPLAGIAITVLIMLWRASSVVANVGDRGVQRLQEFREGSAERGFAAVEVQPVAGLAKMTMAAAFIPGLEIAAQVAVREIDLPFDQPARVFE